MITALDVSNNILKRGFDDDIDITPMKLQKMLYFVYRKYLQETGKSLFNERFETWKYGPVLSSVYYGFKKYGSNSIRDYYRPKGQRGYYAVNEETSLIRSLMFGCIAF